MYVKLFLIFTLNTVYYNHFDIFHGECSSVGRAPGCGSGGRGFDPHHSPQPTRKATAGAASRRLK